MRIAIVGGGAAGVMSAYFLNGKHEIDIFEEFPQLGGNIRTLGKNIPCAGLAEGIYVENGVTGFNRHTYPNFIRLLESLDLKLKTLPVGGGFFKKDGSYFVAPTQVGSSLSEYLQFAREGGKNIKLLPDLIKFMKQAIRTPKEDLADNCLDDFLTSDSDFNKWMRCLAMLSYSMNFSDCRNFPAEVAIPSMKQWMLHSSWTFIEGGVFTYMEKLLENLEANIFVNSKVHSVARDSYGVDIKADSMDKRRYDKVIFACTPEKVLALLAEPSEAEKRRFKNWKPNKAKTIAHNDMSFYARYPTTNYTACDQFEKSTDYGYNTYLNKVYGIQANTHYSFSYNLDELIDPSTILDSFTHRTPLYTLDALSSREQIKETNGENNTYFAGAFLGDGLHEGACQSAMAVAELIDNEQANIRQDRAV